MKHLLIATLLAAAGSAVAAPVNYTIDQSHTYPQFTVDHLGFSTQHGRFNKTSGAIVLDQAAKTGSVDISIDTASIDTGWAKRDEHLKSEDFFNVAKFPAMTFKSKNLKFAGDKLVSVSGDFTLLGVTKPLTLNVSTFKCVDSHPMAKKPWCGADATATIKRSEFGMNTYVPAVGDEVKLTIQIEAMAAK
ncbi:YceI family protein [Chitinilyticum litopenaei]|uniref:YceI family protein n=1 Tax=Chitinilyticum litopenaei TaxID=1121276 RepID=UPI0003F65583|nr:YceI family protein [Chitinilyticum litopenaei]